MGQTRSGGCDAGIGRSRGTCSICYHAPAPAPAPVQSTLAAIAPTPVPALLASHTPRPLNSALSLIIPNVVIGQLIIIYKRENNRSSFLRVPIR